MELPAQRTGDPWPSLRARLRGAVAATTFDVWLSPLALHHWDGAVLSLEAPEPTAAWVSRRYRKLLEACARELLGPEVQVVIVPSGARPGAPTEPPLDQARTPAAAHGSSRPSSPPPRQLTLNPRYSFEQFIIGAGNHIAHAAALSVAEHPGQAFNPLFLYAPPGLGKTHLLHAIGNYVTAYGGGAEVRYATVEAFTNHFVRAISSRSTEDFKNEYRSADVLLIDDVQFLASKAKTEEEFFHTFNSVYENGRQLVITCDRLPSALTGLEQRLRERFSAGMVAEIKPPDHSTRVAILRKRAALDDIALADPAVLDLVAARVTDNIRTLEGALIRVVAYHSLTGRPIDLELASTVLDSMYPLPSAADPLSPQKIRACVATHFSVTEDEILSAGRAARITWPRQVAIYLTRELTDLSLPAIGESFSRNHATVLHACRRVDERLTTDPSSAVDLDRLRAVLKSSTGRPARLTDSHGSP